MRGKVQLVQSQTLQRRITPAYAGKREMQQELIGMVQDHPRLCGEKRTPHELVRHEIGSPPPMRGKAASSIAMFAAVRITPAYAGKRYHRSIWYRLQWDHPRLCGEKVTSVSTSKYTVGSPPPMRGKGHLTDWFFHARRITPAYAGKRHLILHGIHSFLGSPPPMRGKVLLNLRGGQYFRITPAYAGKRLFNIMSTILYRDHPRLCGEKFQADLLAALS